MPRVEGEPGGAAPGTEQEAARMAERDDGDERLGDGARDPVAVPGDAVTAVAVEVGAHRVEGTLVVRRERRADVLERGRQRHLAGDVRPARHQPRCRHDPPVELLLGLLPRRGLEQPAEEVVGMAQPAGDVVDPRGVVEVMPHQAGEAVVRARGAGLLEERRLPREPGGLGHDASSVPASFRRESRG